MKKTEKTFWIAVAAFFLIGLVANQISYTVAGHIMFMGAILVTSGAASILIWPYFAFSWSDKPEYTIALFGGAMIIFGMNMASSINLLEILQHRPMLIDSADPSKLSQWGSIAIFVALFSSGIFAHYSKNERIKSMLPFGWRKEELKQNY